MQEQHTTPWMTASDAAKQLKAAYRPAIERLKKAVAEAQEANADVGELDTIIRADFETYAPTVGSIENHLQGAPFPGGLSVPVPKSTLDAWAHQVRRFGW